LLQKG